MLKCRASYRDHDELLEYLGSGDLLTDDNPGPGSGQAESRSCIRLLRQANCYLSFRHAVAKQALPGPSVNKSPLPQWDYPELRS
jgi:hypothetical protein